MKIKQLLESSKDDILQRLADADINAAYKNGKIIVDKDDVTKTKSILKKLGETIPVSGDLNK